MSALSRARSVHPITGLSVVPGLMLNTASAQAQGTQALAELWRATDARYAGVSMDLDPSGQRLRGRLHSALVKYAPDGTRLWIRTVDGGGDGMAAEEPLGLAVSPDGRLIVLAGKRAQKARLLRRQGGYRRQA